MTSAIQFRDFVPQTLEPGTMLRLPVLAPIETAVSRANDWIRETEVEVISAETLLLPLTGNRMETDTGSFAEFTVGSSRVFQAVRVWYRTPFSR